jgi:hypothetical protein
MLIAGSGGARSLDGHYQSGGREVKEREAVKHKRCFIFKPNLDSPPELNPVKVRARCK